MWPYSRHVRISLNKQHPLPNTCARLQRLNGVDPKLRNPCRRYLATEKQPQSRFSGVRNLSPRPRLHLLEDRVVAEHGKPPLNTLEYPQVDENLDELKDADALEQRDVPKPTKTGGPIQTAKYGDIAQFTKVIEFVKNAGPEPGPTPAPLDLARFAGHQKVAEYPNVSYSKTIAKDPTVQPVRHTVTSNSNKPPPESLSTSSSDLTGVTVDGQGRLQIGSTAEALKERPTALVVSSISRNMLKSDFLRLLAHTPDHEKRPSGLMRGRLDHTTFQHVSKSTDTT
jgi:hypothetical protein